MDVLESKLVVRKKQRRNEVKYEIVSICRSCFPFAEKYMVSEGEGTKEELSDRILFKA